MSLPRFLLPLLLGVGAIHPAHAELNIVATLPAFAAIAQVVGGDQVKISTLARGTEDPHFVTPRPSFIRLLNRADALLHGGADLEIGWLGPLVANARNPRILPGAPGNIAMSEGLVLIGAPAGPTDRSQGDVHPLGNPHFWLDPANGPVMARHVAAVFGQLDPPHAAAYQQNADNFARQIEDKLPLWQKALEPLRGASVLTYHPTYDYLARRFGFTVLNTLEPKPGLEPSATHIAALIPQAHQAGVKLILVEPFRPRRTPDHVADAIGARVIPLPAQVETDDHSRDYVTLFDRIVTLLLADPRP